MARGKASTSLRLNSSESKCKKVTFSTAEPGAKPPLHLERSNLIPNQASFKGRPMDKRKENNRKGGINELSVLPPIAILNIRTRKWCVGMKMQIFACQD